MHLITPTVGRVMLFNPHDRHPEMKRLDREQPLAAMVACVNSDTNVNLVVFDHEGKSFAVQNVTVVHDLETDVIPDNHFAYWMAYQIGQARAHVASEDKAAGEQSAEPARADGGTQQSGLIADPGLNASQDAGVSSSEAELSAGQDSGNEADAANEQQSGEQVADSALESAEKGADAPT